MQVALSGKVPKNYKTALDGYFDAILIDPPSRRVDVFKIQDGVLCGNINSKNSYGGYTGAQTFYALFSPSGEFLEAIIIKPDWIPTILQTKDTAMPDEYKALSVCGLLPPGT
jgi:hypothetical protein